MKLKKHEEKKTVGFVLPADRERQLQQLHAAIAWELYRNWGLQIHKRKGSTSSRYSCTVSCQHRKKKNTKEFLVRMSKCDFHINMYIIKKNLHFHFQWFSLQGKHADELVANAPGRWSKCRFVFKSLSNAYWAYWFRFLYSVSMFLPSCWNLSFIFAVLEDDSLDIFHSLRQIVAVWIWRG